MSEPRFMLDTNICIYMMNQQQGYENIFRHIDHQPHEQVCISSIVLAELQYGISKSVRKAANRERLNLFLNYFYCLNFDAEATRHYGDIRSTLEKQGTPIGPLDTLIAAHARSTERTLITNNVREFERVSDLKVENWLG